MPRSATLTELATLTKSTLVGDGAVVIRGVAAIDEAEEGQLTFCAHKKYVPLMQASRAAAVIVKADFVKDGPPPIAHLIHDEPDYAFAKAAEHLLLDPLPRTPGVHPSAVVSPKARLGDNVSIGALAVIDDDAIIGDNTTIYPHVYVGYRASIGKGCTLYPHAVIRERVTLRDRVTIQPGAIIGADGFGYVFLEGRFEKIPQLGDVVVEDDVEIGANTTVDRARFKSTRVGKGVKLDNQVMIAHNVEIGDHTVMAAQVGVSGSTKIGAYCRFGGQVGVQDHITIGDRVTFGAMSGVAGNIPSDQLLVGQPAREFNLSKRIIMAQGKLPELIKRVREIEKKLGLKE